jgi:TrmH family RNA methyltransferase
MTAISSLQNDRVKLVRALQNQGKTRRQEGRVALEGVRLIADALATGAQPDFVLYTSDAIQGPGAQLFDTLSKRHVTCLEVAPEVMAHAADTQSPQGVIAVIATPNPTPPATLNLVLILDGVADPGNLGTILRTAAAAGVDLVILAPHCVDAFNPKVLRSGMGAHFRVPMLRKSWADIVVEYAELPIYLADANGETTYFQVDWAAPAAVIIGGEARGADSRMREIAGTTISIPMAKDAESLNAAIAASVILFEIRRQRLLLQPEL